MTVVRIKKWGNSLGLRIPKNVADDLDLTLDSSVEIHQEQGKIILTPVQQVYTLAGLVSQITPENLHGEIEPGGSAGVEDW
jgi:antitoxin MazE